MFYASLAKADKRRIKRYWFDTCFFAFFLGKKCSQFFKKRDFFLHFFFGHTRTQKKLPNDCLTVESGDIIPHSGHAFSLCSQAPVLEPGFFLGGGQKISWVLRTSLGRESFGGGGGISR